MQQPYDTPTDEAPDLNEDDLYFQHVIQEDHELMAVDLMLKNAFSPLDE